MERYGQVLLVAIPFFLLLIGLEKWAGWKKGAPLTPVMDTVSSLLAGLSNTVKDVLGLSISILSYGWMVSNLALIKVEANGWVYLAAFIILDFQAYWVHRWAHEINFFWNRHIIHHSSEEFDLACALRQSISSFVQLFTFFLLPAALLGIPLEVIATLAPLHLFAQFWYHTRHIGKMGILEQILVTPSHHRVHHAINPEYLDKNYSAIFIVWDKWFGTFQEELPDVPPVYGITRPVRTWNPIKINFQHLWLLVRDAWHTQNLYDKLRLWWMPTGWRPSDVAERFPVYKIDHVYHFDKYNPKTSPALKFWAVVHLTILLGLSSYLFAFLAEIGSPGIFWYGFFLFLSIYAMAELADGSSLAVFFECCKATVGFVLLYANGGWFGLDTLLPWGSTVVGVYLVVAVLLSYAFRRSVQPMTLVQG